MSPAELGRANTSQCFAESILNDQGKLSFVEFEKV